MKYEMQPTLGTVRNVIEAFREKVEEKVTPSRYIVEGGAMFNSVVRICFAYLKPALRTVLKMDAKTWDWHQLEKSEKWEKVKKQVELV